MDRILLEVPVDADNFTAGSGGGRADYTLVGDEDMEKQTYLITAKVYDSFNTEDQDELNFATEYTWAAIVE